MKTRILACVFLCLMYFSKAQNINNLPQLELAPFAKNFQYPIDLANCGDSRLFVVERLGKIWAIDSTGKKLTQKPFLDITDEVFTIFPDGYDERGLLGLTFHPNFPDSPYFYVNYIGFDSNSHISRFKVDPDNPNKALRNSEVIFLTVSQPKGKNYVNHKAGCLKFGPDGYLYATFGDGGFMGDPHNNAQDLGKFLGKIIRIDVNKPDKKNNMHYSIPSDNPFVGKPNARDEIWACGLRNPFRFSFDKLTGDLWLPDVGQDKWEEINFQKNGAKGGRNYGWSCYEGNHNYKFDGCDYNGLPYTFPIVEYGHTENPCAAITGGFVYRGSMYPKMYGMYVYNDYCTGKYSVVFRNTQTWLNVFMLDEDDAAYVSIGEDTKGELYAINESTGMIEHIIDASQKIAGKQGYTNNFAALNLKLSPNPNKGQFTIELTVPANENYSVSITDAAGTTIFAENKSAVKGLNRWNISSLKLNEGVYMLHVQSARVSLTQNFVVNK
ncbi:MAG: PQQ-dependent sugar dehydrogenase [Parafilimonas sp.]|nr:PQQ-dependent sugar dehydrogenase [Parafilimonas sp.]